VTLKEAVFVFRDGQDDYTLWAVDLHEDVIQNIKGGEQTVGSSVQGLLEDMPILPENAENRFHLLITDGEHPILYAKNMEYSFIEEYCHQGYSVRGRMESVLDELTGPTPAAEIMCMLTN